MTQTAATAGRQLIYACLLSALTLAVYAPRALAQAQPSETKPAEPAQETRTFYLVNTTQPAANDIVTDLRNMLPRAKIYLVSSVGAVTMRGSADDLQLAQRILTEIDRPAKTYRLTFTMNDSNAGKPAGSRSVAIVAVIGNMSEVKLGSKVPIVTGSYDTDSSKANTQVQYIDTGLNIEAWLDTAGDQLHLRTKVAQSTVADEKSNVGIQDPVISQTVLDGQSILVEGKPLVLGTLDAPGGAGKTEIEVVAEQIK